MEDGYDLVGDGINLENVDPIHQRRLVTFVNCWLSHVAKFLNQCGHDFEIHLQQVENRLQRLDAQMSLLEAKLASIPGFENDVVEKVARPVVPKTAVEAIIEVKVETVSPNVTLPVDKSTTVEEQQGPTAPTESKLIVQQDPRYSKYFKMVQMGIPMMAVKQKMQMEGLDSSILDTPNAPSNSSATIEEKAAESDFGGDSDSTASSFSD